MLLLTITLHAIMHFDIGMSSTHDANYASEKWTYRLSSGYCDCSTKPSTSYNSFECASVRKEPTNWFTDCYCEECQRVCTLEEINIDSSACDNDIDTVEERSDKALDHVDDILVKLAAGTLSMMAFKGTAIGLTFAFGVFNAAMDTGNSKLYSAYSDDVNQRIEQLSECVGEQIEDLAIEIQTNEFELAFNKYDLARTKYPSFEAIDEAWTAHQEMYVHFNDLSETNTNANSIGYHESLLMTFQTFLTSFYLVSVDYLKELRFSDNAATAATYDGILRETLGSFNVFKAWAVKGKELFVADRLAKMQQKPCYNGDALGLQIENAAQQQFGSNGGLVTQIENYQVDLSDLEYRLDGHEGWHTLDNMNFAWGMIPNGAGTSSDSFVYLGKVDNFQECKIKAIEDETNEYQNIVYVGLSHGSWSQMCYANIKGAGNNPVAQNDIITSVVGSLAPTPAPTIFTVADGTPCELSSGANSFGYYRCDGCPSCNDCTNNVAQLWLSKESFACGVDPSCLTSGTKCWSILDGGSPTKCMACCNGQFINGGNGLLLCK